MLFLTLNRIFSAVCDIIGLLPSAWNAPGTGMSVGAR
jgi:hypothetical protein